MKLTRITLTEALPVQGLKGIKEFTAGVFPCDTLELTPLGTVLSYSVRVHAGKDSSGHLIGIGSAITKCWVPAAEEANEEEKPKRTKKSLVLEAYEARKDAENAP